MASRYSAIAYFSPRTQPHRRLPLRGGRFGVPSTFETNDLALRRNPGHVLYCLLDVARGGQDCLPVLPTLIRFEQQCDSEAPSPPGTPALTPLPPSPEMPGEPEAPPMLERDGSGGYKLRDQKLFIRCFNKHVVVRSVYPFPSAFQERSAPQFRALGTQQSPALFALRVS